MNLQLSCFSFNLKGRRIPFSFPNIHCDFECITTASFRTPAVASTVTHPPRDPLLEPMHTLTPPFLKKQNRGNPLISPPDRNPALLPITNTLKEKQGGVQDLHLFYPSPLFNKLFDTYKSLHVSGKITMDSKIGQKKKKKDHQVSYSSISSWTF